MQQISGNRVAPTFQPGGASPPSDDAWSGDARSKSIQPTPDGLASTAGVCGARAFKAADPGRAASHWAPPPSWAGALALGALKNYRSRRAVAASRKPKFARSGRGQWLRSLFRRASKFTVGLTRRSKSGREGRRRQNPKAFLCPRTRVFTDRNHNTSLPYSESQILAWRETGGPTVGSPIRLVAVITIQALKSGAAPGEVSCFQMLFPLLASRRQLFPTLLDSMKVVKNARTISPHEVPSSFWADRDLAPGTKRLSASSGVGATSARIAVDCSQPQNAGKLNVYAGWSDIGTNRSQGNPKGGGISQSGRSSQVIDFIIFLSEVTLN